MDDDIKIIYDASKCDEDGGKIIWPCKKRFSENRATVSDDESKYNEDVGKIILPCKKRFAEKRARLSDDDDEEVVFLKIVNRKYSKPKTIKRKKVTVSNNYDKIIIKD